MGWEEDVREARNAGVNAFHRAIALSVPVEQGSRADPANVERVRGAFDASFPRVPFARLRSVVRVLYRAQGRLTRIRIRRVRAVPRSQPPQALPADLDGSSGDDLRNVRWSIQHDVPAINTLAVQSIVVLPRWFAEPGYRVTRLIHEAVHRLREPGRTTHGAVATIEHGPFPLDNAWAYQRFVCELSGVEYVRRVVDRAIRSPGP